MGGTPFAEVDENGDDADKRVLRVGLHFAHELCVKGFDAATPSIVKSLTWPLDSPNMGKDQCLARLVELGAWIKLPHGQKGGSKYMPLVPTKNGVGAAFPTISDEAPNA